MTSHCETMAVSWENVFVVVVLLFVLDIIRPKYLEKHWFVGLNNIIVSVFGFFC